jgi:hypothetical protein
MSMKSLFFFSSFFMRKFRLIVGSTRTILSGAVFTTAEACAFLQRVGILTTMQ